MNARTPQLDLLADQPVARNSDPGTSHEAARRIRPARATQQREILAGCQAHPGHTSAELAAILGMDRYTVARRLPELRSARLVANGDARICTATGSRAMIWLPTGRKS